MVLNEFNQILSKCYQDLEDFKPFQLIISQGLAKNLPFLERSCSALLSIENAID